MLTTVVFVGLARSTERAVLEGDQAWADLVQRYQALTRRQIDRSRGREIDNAGDGFLAIFDGPARAIHCGQASAAAIATWGWRFAAVSTPASVRCSATRWVVLRCTWEPVSARLRVQAKCSFPPQSKISSRARASSSVTGVSTT